MVAGEPVRQSGLCRAHGRAPVFGIEVAHVDPAGGYRQYQVGDELGPAQRGKQGDDASHRLGDDGAGLVDLRKHLRRQVADACDGWIGRNAAEAGPGDVDLGGGAGQVAGQGTPEFGSARRAWEKEELGWFLHERNIHDVLRAAPADSGPAPSGCFRPGRGDRDGASLRGLFSSPPPAAAASAHSSPQTLRWRAGCVSIPPAGSSWQRRRARPASGCRRGPRPSPRDGRRRRSRC